MKTFLYLLCIAVGTGALFLLAGLCLSPGRISAVVVWTIVGLQIVLPVLVANKGLKHFVQNTFGRVLLSVGISIVCFVVWFLIVTIIAFGRTGMKGVH
jgi:hypothetical protein